VNLGHSEIFVKVNASVDRGIAELVCALSEIDGLETIASCEGYQDGPKAYVIFRFGGWRECGEFLFDRLLPAMDADLRSDVGCSIDGYATDNCHGRISLSAVAVGSVSELVRSVRRCAYSCDKART